MKSYTLENTASSESYLPVIRKLKFFNNQLSSDLFTLSFNEVVVKSDSLRSINRVGYFAFCTNIFI